MKNIILIGFMGTGKSAVGRCLAKALNMQYIDTDEMIEKREGRTINDIFAGPGESFFREAEAEMLDILEGVKDHVIATGGGIILRSSNVEKLKKLGKIVLLWTRPEIISERLKDKSDRPLLNVPDPSAKIREILDQRKPLYEKAADMVVDTSTLSAEDACNKIAEGLREER